MFSLKYFRQHDGKDLYLAGMSSIGPFTSPDTSKALRFATEQEAMEHPAYCHPTCLLDVVPSPQQ